MTLGNVWAVFLFEWHRAMTVSRIAWWAVLVLFPVFMIWTMGIGLGDAEIDWLPEGVSYVAFIMPGLIMMTVISTGFFNTGFVIMFEKEYSDAFDGLVQTPVTTEEIALAKIVAGTLKSLINGLISMLVVMVFVDIELTSSAGISNLRVAAPPLPWTIQPGQTQVIELQYERPSASAALLTLMGHTFEIGGLR